MAEKIIKSAVLSNISGRIKPLEQVIQETNPDDLQDLKQGDFLQVEDSKTQEIVYSVEINENSTDVKNTSCRIKTLTPINKNYIGVQKYIANGKMLKKGHLQIVAMVGEMRGGKEPGWTISKEYEIRGAERFNQYSGFLIDKGIGDLYINRENINTKKSNPISFISNLFRRLVA